MLKTYLKKISDVYKTGDAREESYYSVLESLLRQYAESTNNKKIHITTLPKKTEAGNPDFRVWDGKQHIVGYIEAKAPTVQYLDQIETTDQIKRYLNIFPNLILTNFFEFRLYRDGELIDKVSIARPFILQKLKTIPVVENEIEFLKLLEKYFSFSFPKVYNAKTLAMELAKRTRFLKDEVVSQELKKEEGVKEGHILGFYEAFRQYLISGLTQDEFADLYSQTITYGLFAARTRSEDGFNRKLAYDNIPRTIGILRDVFRFISLEDIPQQMEWIIDDISEVLAVTDVKKILHEYFHEGKGKDPIVHFYETFLAEYDPKAREKRGVYYTPEPVVSHIVRSLHNILKDYFNRKEGFASDSVTVLDPAAGTLTFLAEASKTAVEEFVSKYGEGGKEDFIKEHILKDFYAFELMMAPYAVGHLKMSFLLEELGYKLRKDDRFKLYLTNTLEMEELAQTELPGMVSLSEESHSAGKVKKEQPILVILGNPPYSGISANKGNWIDDLLKKGYKRRDGSKDDGYYRVDGKSLGEKKLWLQDDYVKFIRFSQWKIDQAGEGVLGFITNHSYLDNPTFRGMRQSLSKSFNEIYILDLHGNSLKKEKCPDGSKDENVFDIQQGVSIALFIKCRSELVEGKKAKRKGCKIFHSEIWGLREKKNDWLLQNDKKTVKWKKLNPTRPYYFLIPREEKGKEVYEKYCGITDIFSINVTGIVTARDHFVIDIDKGVLKRRIGMFRNLSMPDEIIQQTFKLKDTRGWKFIKARKELAKDQNWDEYFTRVLYRPFDIRHIYYTQQMVDWPRPEVMPHMMEENLGLILPKRVETKIPWSHILCTNEIAEHVTVSLKTIDYVFPLFLYANKEKEDLFNHNKTIKRRPNIKTNIFKTLTSVYKIEPTPEVIFNYIYAILYSEMYRRKYAEFLKTDFPRVPFTKKFKPFGRMVEYGKRLVDLHLLKSNELDQPIAKYQGKGNNKVERVKYEQNKVCINNDQYFVGVSPDIWQYQIGGYQVCDKWLKDRKGRALSLDEIRHYCQVVTAIQKTIEIQRKIDDLYPEIEKETIEFIIPKKE
ncbi:MAG: DNA methyltransferase [Deltaproteobacteria bacterium]|nr:DNA methyltransferase [Deltaproteobacteria bacterium]